MQSEAADVIQIGSHTLPLEHLKKHPSSDGDVEYIENNVHDSKLSSSASGPSAENDGPLHRPSDHSNGWCRIRHLLREPFAEFLGTCLLIIFGTGVNLQVVLDSSKDVSPGGDKGSYLSISWGWGIGVMMGVYVSGGISGGHINPAVTLSLATFRGFPWKKVPGYILAQVLGAMSGAAITYITYVNGINLYEGAPNRRTVSGPGSTAALFSTYPMDYMTDVSSFFNEFVNTAILLIVILSLGDRNNGPPPTGLNPLVLLFLIVGLGACMGSQTAYCMNPARDFGPRLLTWFVGYGRDVWTFRNHYWLWTPWIATISGGLTGCFIYDLLIYNGPDSPLNARWNLPTFGKGSKAKMPAGKEEV